MTTPAISTLDAIAICARDAIATCLTELCSFAAARNIAVVAVDDYVHGAVDHGSDDLADLLPETRGLAWEIVMHLNELGRGRDGTDDVDVSPALDIAAWAIRAALGAKA